MDTVAVDLSRPDAGTMTHLINQVLDGKDAVVVGVDGGASFLRDAVVLLRDRRCRVIPVSAAVPGTFTLSALLAQVTGKPDLDVQDDETLERGFQALTVPDPGCDRIVLVIDGADCLQESAFRYLAFTCKASTELQLVLAGRTDQTARLGEGAAFLHARLTERPAFRIGPAAPRQPERRRLVTIPGGPVTHGVPEVGDMPERQPGPASGKRRAVWIVAGLGMAASVVLGFGLGWQARSGSHTVTAAPAASTRTEPADPPGRAGTVPTMPLPGSGSVAPEVTAAPPAQAAAPAMAPPANVGPAHSQSLPAGPGLDPPSTGTRDVPPGLEPAPAVLSLPLLPPGTAATPGPDMQAAPAEPGQPPVPPAGVPSAAVIPAMPMRPTAPHALPDATGQGRQQQASSPSSHPRSSSSSASRTRPPLDVEEPRHRSEPSSGHTVQAVPPQGANPPASRPAIGSFTVGPDGVRVFHPNP